MAKLAVNKGNLKMWVSVVVLAGSLALVSGAHIARADEQFDGETGHLPAGTGTSVSQQDTTPADTTPADVREAKSVFDDMQVRGRRVRDEANHAKGAADGALGSANWLLDRANNCSLDFAVYLNDYQTNERYANSAISDISNKAFQDLVARSKKASAAVQDDALRQKFVDDTDFWSKFYQAQIYDSTKQANATLQKARATADEAVKLYNQKCRPILEPQTVPAYAPLFPPIGLNGKPLVRVVCADGSVLWVPDLDNPFVPYLPGCSTMPSMTSPTGTNYENIRPNDSVWRYGPNGLNGNPGGNGPMKSMTPTDPLFPQMPGTGNPSRGASPTPGTTPTQTINTTIGAPVIK
jgi:hypothetical protein